MTETTPRPATDVHTIAGMSARAAERYGPRSASRHLVDGEWVETTYAETGAEIDAIARGLIALGLAPGDRIGVLADTRQAPCLTGSRYPDRGVTWLSSQRCEPSDLSPLMEWRIASCSPRDLLSREALEPA